MPYPSVPALVRAWNVSNGMAPVTDPTTGEVREVPTRYFSTLPPDTDPRILARQSWGRRRVFPPHGIDDPLRRGWLLREQGARRILSNVFYIGWVVRDGIIVRGEVLENGQVRVDATCLPLVLHEPIVQDQELFWYCFDRVSAYTIEGRPNPKRRFYTKGPRQQYNDEAELQVFNPRPTAVRNAETNSLLLLGKVWCGVHKHAFMRHRRRPTEPDYYLCKYRDDALGHRQNYCTYLPGAELDRAVVQEFLSRLQLTDDDVEGIARAWQAAQQREQAALLRPKSMTRGQEIETELANLATGVARTSMESVRQRLVAEMERLTAELEHVRQQVHDHDTALREVERQPLSPRALQVARKSARALEALRTKWEKASLTSRQALMQWVVQSVTLVPARDDRKRIDGQIVWRGGAASHLDVMRAHDRRQGWEGRELEVLGLWYASAWWSDLHALLPGRSHNSIIMMASRLGLAHRPRHPGSWQRIPADELARLAPTGSRKESCLVDMSSGAPSSAGLDCEALLGLVNVLDCE